VLSAIVFTDSQERAVEDPEEISHSLDRAGEMVWVDLEQPTEQDYAWIEQEFHLHPLAMGDARRTGQRPKLDLYGSHSFVVAYSGKTTDVTDLPEVDVFVGPDWLVTVRTANASGELFDVELARDRFRRTRGEDGGDAVGFLLYSILDELVLGYFDTIERIEDDIEDLEGTIFMGESATEPLVQRNMLALRRTLLQFRRRVVPLREVVTSILRREVPWVDLHNLMYFQDVLNHLLRAIDELDNQRELLGNAVDAHLAMQGNRMNVIMKKMTSWGAILICATMVTGIYGMNFHNLPLLENDYGYWVSLGMMLSITVGGYLYFKRKDWL